MPATLNVAPLDCGSKTLAAPPSIRYTPNGSALHTPQPCLRPHRCSEPNTPSPRNASCRRSGRRMDRSIDLDGSAQNILPRAAVRCLHRLCIRTRTLCRRHLDRCTLYILIASGIVSTAPSCTFGTAPCPRRASTFGSVWRPCFLQYKLFDACQWTKAASRYKNAQT